MEAMQEKTWADSIIWEVSQTTVGTITDFKVTGSLVVVEGEKPAKKFTRKSIQTDDLATKQEATIAEMKADVVKRFAKMTADMDKLRAHRQEANAAEVAKYNPAPVVTPEDQAIQEQPRSVVEIVAEQMRADSQLPDYQEPQFDESWLTDDPKPAKAEEPQAATVDEKFKQASAETAERMAANGGQPMTLEQAQTYEAAKTNKAQQVIDAAREIKKEQDTTPLLTLDNAQAIACETPEDAADIPADVAACPDCFGDPDEHAAVCVPRLAGGQAEPAKPSQIYGTTADVIVIDDPFQPTPVSEIVNNLEETKGRIGSLINELGAEIQQFKDDADIAIYPGQTHPVNAPTPEANQNDSMLGRLIGDRTADMPSDEPEEPDFAVLQDQANPVGQFRITDRAGLEWYGRKLAGKYREKEVLQKAYQAALKEIDEEIKGFEGYFEAQAEGVTQELLAHEKGKKSVKTLGGTFGYRTVSGGFRVEDKTALLEWATATNPESVRSTVTLQMDKITADHVLEVLAMAELPIQSQKRADDILVDEAKALSAKVADGLPPGCVIKPDEEKFYWKVE